MSHGASHVEYALGVEVWIILLDPCYDAITHVGIVPAHLTHRVDVDCSVVNRTLGHVVINVFGVIAARLTMDIHSAVVLRQWEIWRQSQRSDRVTLHSRRCEVGDRSRHRYLRG